jgi:ABC-type transporter Mla subunit MlaD
VPDRDSNGQPSAEEQLRALYDNAESATTRAFEQAVSSPTFGALLARSAENVAAMSRIGSDVADLVLRNLRVASRSDITRLARQLHRTEDKLERVLQEIEQLRDELAAAQRPATANGRAETPNAPRRRSGSRSTGSRSATT